MRHKDFKYIKTIKDISEYELKSNGLRLLYKHIPDTGVVTTNIVYKVGARDEMPGETGIAHMLEHMLFKPTVHDKKLKKTAASMLFERETGSILNANTWKDRTTYFFSYDKVHFARALQIEVERMRDVLLIDKEFLPERTNVLSEYDMYNGMPEFAISFAMVCTAFRSHPYGHETIGFREDIEAYTVEKLQRFYNHFYRPNNAVLMVVGDVPLKEVQYEVSRLFSGIEPEPGVKERPVIVEPKQEGVRRVEIVRPGITNVLGIGVKHGGFPTQNWFESHLVLKLLADGSDSLLYKRFVDTGLASEVSYMQEPTKDNNLAILYITLTDKITHEEAEKIVKETIANIELAWLKKHLKAVVTASVNSELFNRDSSLDIVSELTEYVSAGDWSDYFDTEQKLQKITTKQIQDRITEMFDENNLTIGTYKSI